MNLDTVGGRRWVAFLLLGALATLGLWHGKLTGAQWLEAATWFYGIFVTGNVTQRGVEAAKEIKGAAPPSPGA